MIFLKSSDHVSCIFWGFFKEFWVWSQAQKIRESWKLLFCCRHCLPGSEVSYFCTLGKNLAKYHWGLDVTMLPSIRIQHQSWSLRLSVENSWKVWEFKWALKVELKAVLLYFTCFFLFYSILCPKGVSRTFSADLSIAFSLLLRCKYCFSLRKIKGKCSRFHITLFVMGPGRL